MRIPSFKTDEGATRYKDTVGTKIAPRVADIVIDMAETWISGGADRLLDVACGPGTVCLQLAQKHPNVDVVAADYSPAMLRQCALSAERLGLSNIAFTEMNANDLDFSHEAPFDLVVCNLAFPFFSRPVESMKGFYRATAPSGHVVLSAPGGETWAEFFDIAEEVLGEAIVMAKPFLAKIQQASKLSTALSEAGFQNLEVSRHKLPFEFDNGETVLEFFNQLFALLSYAPPEIQGELTKAINHRYPNGFTMHYEAMVVSASR